MVDRAALLPLTSSYDEDQHGSYVVRLTEALADTKLRNIALTGNYGTGKSSILDQVRDQGGDRILNLSLSSLGDTAPDAADMAGADAESKALTNRIQKEIV